MSRTYICEIMCQLCHRVDALKGEQVELLIKEDELPPEWVHCHECELDYCNDCVLDGHGKCPNNIDCQARVCSRCINLFNDTYECCQCSKLVCTDCIILTVTDNVVFCSRECLQKHESQFQPEEVKTQQP